VLDASTLVNRVLDTPNLQALLEDWDAKDSIVTIVMGAAGPWLALQGLAVVGFTAAGVAAGKPDSTITEYDLQDYRESGRCMASCYRNRRFWKSLCMVTINGGIRSAHGRAYACSDCCRKHTVWYLQVGYQTYSGAEAGRFIGVFAGGSREEEWILGYHRCISTIPNALKIHFTEFNAPYSVGF
jgi:hypothetical protein